MEIYIKPVKKFKADDKRDIRLKDIADVYMSGTSAEKFKNIILLNIKSEKRQNYLISIMDIVKSISNMDPKLTVINVGETDTLVEFTAKPHKDNTVITWVKTICISVILFFGAATAIMSFHADGEIPKILQGYYKIFYGKEEVIPYILEIPYSIGLAVGIIVFYNHFSALKMSYDPTPIEVQMSTYENEVITNQVETLEKKEENK